MNILPGRVECPHCGAQQTNPTFPLEMAVHTISCEVCTEEFLVEVSVWTEWDVTSYKPEERLEHLRK